MENVAALGALGGLGAAVGFPAVQQQAMGMEVGGSGIADPKVQRLEVKEIMSWVRHGKNSKLKVRALLGARWKNGGWCVCVCRNLCLLVCLMKL
jgi:hypothetical protein